MSGTYDFLAIGDIVTDAFIRLEVPSAHLDIDHGVRELCVRFGDKIPYREVIVVPAVGNSTNAATAAARLGLTSALVANLGDDYYGKECLATLAVERVSTEFVSVHPGAKTNYHYVLWFDDDRTILVKHEPYHYSFPEVGNPKWMYLSSLGAEAVEMYDDIVAYLDAHPGIKFAFQPGTYQIQLGVEKLKQLYKRTELFFCNKEESQRILTSEESDIKKLLEGICKLGPKIAIITDGKAGAYAFDGNRALFMPLYPDPKPPLQRTGAGDAFSSTVTVAFALGLDFETALRWGPINSMSVVQHVGAREGLLTRKALERYLSYAPQNYFAKEI